MNTYDVKCPVCGVVNRILFLEETGGWMECEHCGHTAKYCWEPQTKKQIPVFVIRNLQAQVVPIRTVPIDTPDTPGSFGERVDIPVTVSAVSVSRKVS